MMREESQEFLKNLINSVGPSGFEGETVEVWKKRTSKFTEELKTDVHGNSIGVINKDGKPRVMLAGHIDEIGYMVKYIDKGGFIYFSIIGGIDLHIIPGERVWIKGKKGKIPGIIGRKPIHQIEKEEREKVSKLEDLFIDIGAKDKKEVESLIDIGDPAVPAVGYEPLLGDRAVGRAFDDRSGAFVVSEVLRRLEEEKIEASVYGVATVQEEIGLRGAKTSAFGINPDVGIAIDVTFASDYPHIESETKRKKYGDIRIGKGPVIARGPNINPRVFDLFVKTAKEENLPYQVEPISKATGTDANVIQLTRAGVAAGLISIPNRYMHTPVELVSIDDLDNASKLIAGFIKRLSKKSNLIPY
jgi:endoglucanase